MLLVVGTHRATRLVTADKLPLIGVPREKFVERWGVFDDAKGDERKISISERETNIFMSSIAYLWECPWCMSIWIGSLLTYLTYMWPDTMMWVLLVGVASTVTGFISHAESLIDAKMKKVNRGG